MLVNIESGVLDAWAAGEDVHRGAFGNKMAQHLRVCRGLPIYTWNRPRVAENLLYDRIQIRDIRVNDFSCRWVSVRGLCGAQRGMEDRPQSPLRRLVVRQTLDAPENCRTAGVMSSDHEPKYLHKRTKINLVSSKSRPL